MCLVRCVNVQLVLFSSTVSLPPSGPRQPGELLRHVTTRQCLTSCGPRRRTIFYHLEVCLIIFFFLYDLVLFCVHINLRVKFCLWGFFLAEGTGFFSYPVFFFCIFKLCYCMCAVLMLILYPALLAHIYTHTHTHTLYTHTHTKSFIDQCLCFDPSWGFTFNGQAVNTQHAQLVNPVRSRSPQPHRRQENVCLSCLSPIR